MGSSDTSRSDPALRWAKWTALSNIIYAALTLIMLWQLFESNNLTRRSPGLTLRPYVSAEAQQTLFAAAKRPEERWFVSTTLINKGDLPAVEVQTHSWIDQSKNFQEQKPAEVRRLFLSPRGGSLITVADLSKREAVDQMAAGREIYLHVMVRYKDRLDRLFTHSATYQGHYAEGAALIWEPIEISGS